MSSGLTNMIAMTHLTVLSFNKDFRYLPLICRGNKACGLFLKLILQADYAPPRAVIRCDQNIKS